MDAGDDGAAVIARGLEALLERRQPMQRAQFVDQEPQSEVTRRSARSSAC